MSPCVDPCKAYLHRTSHGPESRTDTHPTVHTAPVRSRGPPDRAGGERQRDACITHPRPSARGSRHAVPGYSTRLGDRLCARVHRWDWLCAGCNVARESPETRGSVPRRRGDPQRLHVLRRGAREIRPLGILRHARNWLRPPMHCVATGPAHGSLSKDKLRGDICIAVLLPPRRGETLLVLDSGAARYVADTHCRAA